jgi:cell division septation protein DedD
MQTLQLVDPYVGRYYSAEWVKKNILQQTDEDIEEINAQMANEAASAQPTDANGNPVQLDANGQPVQAQVPANAPPPTPSQDVQQQQPQQQQQEDGSTKEQEDPLIDKKKMRFINDTMEIA